MGYYVDLLVNITLVNETPSEVLNVIKKLCGESVDESVVYNERWGKLFINDCAYLPQTACTKLSRKISGCRINGEWVPDGEETWSFLGKGSVNNLLTNDIIAFFKFIQPWTEWDDDLIGYYRDEKYEPVLVYKTTTWVENEWRQVDAIQKPIDPD